MGQVREGGTRESPRLHVEACRGDTQCHFAPCCPRQGGDGCRGAARRWGVLHAAVTAASLQLLDACIQAVWVPPAVWAPLFVTPSSLSLQAQDTWQWQQAAQRVRDQAPCLLTRTSVQAASPRPRMGGATSPPLCSPPLLARLEFFLSFPSQRGESPGTAAPW